MLRPLPWRLPFVPSSLARTMRRRRRRRLRASWARLPVVPAMRRVLLLVARAWTCLGRKGEEGAVLRAAPAQSTDQRKGAKRGATAEGEAQGTGHTGTRKARKSTHACTATQTELSANRSARSLNGSSLFDALAICYGIATLKIAVTLGEHAFDMVYESAAVRQGLEMLQSAARMRPIAVASGE